MTDWRGTVHWRTASVAFVLAPSGKLRAVHDTATPAFPFSYLVAPGCLRRLERGTQVSYANGELRLGAAGWSAEPVAIGPGTGTAPPHPADLDEWLGPLEPPSQVPRRLLTAFAEELADPGPSTAARRLIGLGPGLTPAGDDVLLGAWAMATRWRAAWEGTDVGAALSALLPAARGLTTRLSAALFAEAARGRFAPALAEFAGGAGDGAERARATARDLRAVGSSSGTAALWGARLAVTALAPGGSRLRAWAPPDSYRSPICHQSLQYCV